MSYNSHMWGGNIQPKLLEIIKLKEVEFSRCIGGVGEKKSNGGTQYYQQDRVYTMGDVCLALPAQLPYGSYNYLEIKKLEDIKQLGKLEEGSSQRRIVYDDENLSPTLQAAMGAGGGNVPLTIEQNTVAMRGRNPENPSDRTKGIELEQKLEPNSQGLCNTLTSVQKDNLVLEKQKVEVPKKIKIRQATKQGFIECEIGGGMLLRLPDKHFETRPNNRERTDKPDNNDGEYP